MIHTLNIRPYSTAVGALQRMELPDAPFIERTIALYSTKLVAWQKWAIAKGYVPKECGVASGRYKIRLILRPGPGAGRWSTAASGSSFERAGAA